MCFNCSTSKFVTIITFPAAITNGWLGAGSGVRVFAEGSSQIADRRVGVASEGHQVGGRDNNCIAIGQIG